VLAVDESIANDMIRILDTMPEDAIFLDSRIHGSGSLTWDKLMLFKRFSVLSARPFLISVPLGITPDELQIIWDMGVDAVVVDIAGTYAVDSLKEIYQAVDSLIVPSKRKHKKSRALVPAVKEQAAVAANGDDDDDEPVEPE
jgi:hypothetical protein